MISKIRNNKAAFTLVEIMIVVAIIGLLAALAIPGFVKARKQSQGRRILNDARQMDAAIDQWALEKGKKDGDAINTTEAATYLKGAWQVNDLLGNPYSFGSVGSNQVVISSTTKDALAGVGIDWGPY
jgi:type IV pilus assembly protein PilA